MKNNNIVSLFLVIYFLFSPAISISGILSDKIDKAEELANLVGYKTESSNYLKQAILENPTDAKIHFRAGEVYEKMGLTADAYRCYYREVFITSSLLYNVH